MKEGDRGAGAGCEDTKSVACGVEGDCVEDGSVGVGAGRLGGVANCAQVGVDVRGECAVGADDRLRL